MKLIADNVLENLSQPYQLSKEQIHFYQQHRYIKLRQVLDVETLEFFNQSITDQVAEMNTDAVPLENRDTYGKAFLQLFNLWRENDTVKALIFSKRIAKTWEKETKS